MSDPAWYLLLELAQSYWTGVFAVHFPYLMMSAPTALTTADGGLTYTFPGGIYPLAVELYDATGPATLLRPGAYFDSSADIVWEGNQIRFPQNQGNFGINPVARYVAPPGVLDASTPPTLMPPHARMLLVYRAVGQWAAQGGMRDPGGYFGLEQRAWLGNPATGDVGLLGTLKLQNTWYGGSAIEMPSGGILSSVDTGAGYRALPP
jgi:hypothetical protein